MYRVRVFDNNRFSKVQQIVGAVAKDIDKGVLKTGERLPTINEFSGFNGVARDTIEKAYGKLKASGYIESYPGRGYFVLDRKNSKTRVLLAFNSLNFFNKTIYNLLQEGLGKRAKIDVCLHHGRPKALADILETNCGRYDYYLLLMHFRRSVKQHECKQVLDAIPQHELILLGNDQEIWKQETNLIYQDFRYDVYKALRTFQALAKKYKRISLISSPSENYPVELIEGVEDYCGEEGMEFEVISKLNNHALREKSVYVVEEQGDLARLMKKLWESKQVIGKDVGIICLQESAFTELLDITVFTPDFTAMRDAVTAIILGNKRCNFKNPFYIIQRGSL